MCAGSAEVAEWTEMGEWHVGGCAAPVPATRGEWGFELDRGLGSRLLERGRAGGSLAAATVTTI